ncbi:MAG: cofactor assembly of complex C subunit B [Pseudanabaenaceae cyanobacterium bins.68]|nr:cofactor assembly of complex C subunit B [Pseudanabaenaceae cyanobacterium bins.68]
MLQFSLSSSLILTLMLLVGLIFFLRAAVKDRTTEMLLRHPHWQQEEVLAAVAKHLRQRSFQVVAYSPDQELVTLSGQVAPSVGLLLLLILIAAVGFSCLSLVLTILLPDWPALIWSPLLAVPGVGIFYWRGAARLEQVTVGWRSPGQLWIKAHKDEIRTLQTQLGFSQE